MMNLKTSLHAIWRFSRHLLPFAPRSRWGRRLLIGFIGLVLLTVGGMYGIARWYVHSVSGQPQIVGSSFIPSYAEYLGVDPQQTLNAMLYELHIKHLRLVSYWDQTEPVQGQYDFSQLDWQFAAAEKAGAKITLSVGLRQPRWPECHPPSWVDTSKPTAQWQPQLEAFMTQVIDRYKDSPALQDYQVENEYFLKAFGQCQNFDRSRLVSEVALVHRLDPGHRVVLTRSNNGLGTPAYAPKGDVYGVSVYKRVWDAGLSHRYLEYPQPSWYYAFMAGVGKITQGRDLNIHEMQAEAWAPAGQDLKSTSLAEQNKSLDARRLAGRFKYARDSGLRQIDMWGAEYWYYRMQVLHDPSLWLTARAAYAEKS